MVKRKRKSIQDIRNQLVRIAGIKGGSTDNIMKAVRIGNTYMRNIQDAVGKESMTPLGNRFITADARQKVSSRVYRGLSNG